MDEDEFAAEMKSAIERALLNPDYPVIKSTEEADALHDDFMTRLWGFVLEGFTPAVATGEYLDLWCTNNTAPADKPKPNHVRDAVRANQ